MDELQKKLQARLKLQGEEAPEGTAGSGGGSGTGGPGELSKTTPGKLKIGGFNPLAPGGGPPGGAPTAATLGPGVTVGNRSSTPGRLNIGGFNPLAGAGPVPLPVRAQSEKFGEGRKTAELEPLPSRNSGPVGRKKPTRLNNTPIGTPKSQPAAS
mmetsp:Transcript_20812/g.32615  ORF Transcript_20812/g.32615 Transcript_20812/m.32615 type:complete len:155 (-) Transcript_20812:216-680(-)